MSFNLDNLPSEVKELVNNLSSKVWRMNNLYYIKDKKGKEIKFTLNNAQETVLRKYKHNKKIILKSRQRGISTLYVIDKLDDCMFHPGFEAGVQSYGLTEAKKLSRKAVYAWERIPEVVKKLIGIKLDKMNADELVFSNGSTLKIGNFRGDTLQSLHVSELAKIAKAYPAKALELQAGAFQAVAPTSTITIESTAEGESGLFYDMWCKAEIAAKSGRELTPLDFQAIFLPWFDDLDCRMDSYYPPCKKTLKYISEFPNIEFTQPMKNWLAAKINELGDKFDQEYPATPEMAFKQPVEGTYYANEYRKLKIDTNLYDPNLLVHSAIDLGVSDTFAVGFFQVDIYNQVRIIGDYGNTGVGLEHYRDIFSALATKYGWKYGITYVPHDISVRELIAGKTRLTAMRELGWDPILVNKHRVVEGIEATRQFLKEVIIDEKATDTIRAIQSYRKKYDEKYKVYLDTPVHDEFSHHADMLRYLAMGFKYRKPSKNLVNIIPERFNNNIAGFEI